MSGMQGGDPAKLAEALVRLASQDEPPLRWPAGADAVETFEQKATRPARAGRRPPRPVLVSLAHDDTEPRRGQASSTSRYARARFAGRA